MYLLNPGVSGGVQHVDVNFTFHNVSIKSVYRHSRNSVRYPLHSTMFLLNLAGIENDIKMLRALHSTMFLLNLDHEYRLTILEFFTFHNVSIKSRTE